MFSATTAIIRNSIQSFLPARRRRRKKKPLEIPAPNSEIGPFKAGGKARPREVAAGPVLVHRNVYGRVYLSDNSMNPHVDVLFLFFFFFLSFSCRVRRAIYGLCTAAAVAADESPGAQPLALLPPRRRHNNNLIAAGRFRAVFPAVPRDPAGFRDFPFF